MPLTSTIDGNWRRTRRKTTREKMCKGKGGNAPRCGYRHGGRIVEGKTDITKEYRRKKLRSF